MVDAAGTVEAASPEPHDADHGESTGRSVHQPGLDGLRAIAVGAVVLYHFTAANSNARFGRGGFLGVDIFFVLSGFLISGLLLREHAHSGKIDLRSFWVRRFRRLFPAIVVMLALVALFLVMSPSPKRLGVRDDTIWTLFYAQNWHIFLGEQGYTPLSHTWSLSVEEQWYLIWPASLWAILSLAHGRTRTILLVILGLAFTSAIWTSAVFVHYGWSRAYDGTDTRAQELLLGAALAYFLQGGNRFKSRRSQRILEIAGWLGVLVIGLTIVLSHPSDAFFYDGGFVLLAIAVAAVITAVVHSPGPLGRTMSWRPLVLMGLVSYGIYLFHVPVMGLITPGHHGLEGPWVFVVRIVLLGLVAAGSYLLIENPIRRQRAKLSSPKVWVPGVVIFGLSMAVIIGLGAPAGPSYATRLYMVAGQAAKHDPVRLLVVGDWPATQLLAPNRPVNGVSVEPFGFRGCGFASGPIAVGSTRYPLDAACEEWPKGLGDAVSAYRPTHVALVVGNMEAYDRAAGRKIVPAGSLPWIAELDSRLTLARSIAKLSGATVTLVPTACPGIARPLGSLPTLPNDGGRSTLVSSAIDRYAASNHLSVWHLDDLMCPGGQPLRVKDGHQVTTESQGLTPGGSAVASNWFAQQANTSAH